MAVDAKPFDDLDEIAVNTIRTLSIDAIQKANSGHPGNADGARPARLRRGGSVTATTMPVRENPLVEALEREPIPPTTLVIFGVTGDLARRKLLPAIYNLAHEGSLPDRFNLIGVARGSRIESFEAGRRLDRGVLPHRAGQRRPPGAARADPLRSRLV